MREITQVNVDIRYDFNLAVRKVLYSHHIDLLVAPGEMQMQGIEHVVLFEYNWIERVIYQARTTLTQLLLKCSYCSLQSSMSF